MERSATPPADLSRAAKPRPRSELVMRLFAPLARALVRLLAPLGVDPQAVVLSHTALGLVAAALVAAGDPAGWLAAAALLQVKTLLDNTDGALARATGRVTEAGRYLDSLMDLLVNAALFAALALHGPPLAALAAFATLTVILSLDYNMERRYKALRGDAADAAAPAPAAPPGAPPRVLALLRSGYRRLLAPQDRAIDRLDAALFARVHGAPYAAAPLEYRLAWSDLFSTAALVNLGLSTQLLLLGALLALGRPFAYVWLVLLQGAWVLCVQLLRLARLRRYLRAG